VDKLLEEFEEHKENLQIKLSPGKNNVFLVMTLQNCQMKRNDICFIKQ
jgi:hypothetical protein